MSVTESEKRRIELGPLFATGVVLVVYGLLRRRVLAVATGVGAMWLDQRSEFGRSVKEKARARFLTVQYVDADRDETRATS